MWKPSVSEPPSSAPDMSEAEEGDPVRDGDGGSQRPAAGVVERAASSATVDGAAGAAAADGEGPTAVAVARTGPL